MKSIAFILTALLATIAFADSTKYTLEEDPRFELIHCSAPRNGHVFMSFGHLMTTESTYFTYFPVTISTFDQNSTGNWELASFNDMPKDKLVNVGPGRAKLEFTMQTTQGLKTHEIALLKYPGADTPNAYIGNWVTKVAGQEDVYDQAACSIY